MSKCAEHSSASFSRGLSDTRLRSGSGLTVGAPPVHDRCRQPSDVWVTLGGNGLKMRPLRQGFIPFVKHLSIEPRPPKNSKAPRGFDLAGPSTFRTRFYRSTKRGGFAMKVFPVGLETGACLSSCSNRERRRPRAAPRPRAPCAKQRTNRALAVPWPRALNVSLNSSMY